MTFVIGPQAVPFTIHAGFLVERCPAFAETCLGASCVRDTATIDGNRCVLAQESARTFWIFLVWLYTNKLVSPPEDLGCDTDGVEVRGRVPCARLADEFLRGQAQEGWIDEDLVDAYLFGRRHHIDALSTVAISTLAKESEGFSRTASLASVHKAFDAGHWAVLLCEYLVDEAEWRLDEQGWDQIDDMSAEALSIFPHEYISRVQRAKPNPGSVPKSRSSWREAACRYHTHHGTKEQERCSHALGKRGLQNTHTSVMYRHLEHPGTVRLDADALPIVVHKGLISEHAAFFRGAFSGDFTEGKTGHVEVFEDDFITFLMMTNWLYTGKLHVPAAAQRQALATLDELYPKQLSYCGQDASNTGQRYSPPGSPEVDLVMLYILADRREIRRLRNEVLNGLIFRREKGCSLLSSNFPLIQVAFISLPPSAKLCSFLIDEATWGWDEGLAHMDDLTHLPADFLGKVVQKMVQLRRERKLLPPWRQNLCVYHEHVDDAEKAACRERSKGYQAKLKQKGAAMEPVSK